MTTEPVLLDHLEKSIGDDFTDVQTFLTTCGYKGYHYTQLKRAVEQSTKPTSAIVLNRESEHNTVTGYVDITEAFQNSPKEIMLTESDWLFVRCY